MKTYRRLYPRIWDWDNLHLAYRKARKGKRGKRPAAEFEFKLEDNLVALQDELAAKTYQPGPYYSFLIYEPKRRLISAAPFRDRVVHHALCNVIEPIFERRFIYDSYANRVGKGTHRALDRCQSYARKYRYVLSCDVRQFFPSIDHAFLRATLGRYIRDEDAMWLVDRIMESGVGVLAEEYEMAREERRLSLFPAGGRRDPHRPPGKYRKALLLVVGLRVDARGRAFCSSFVIRPSSAIRP